MSKKSIYLLGILVAIVIGTILYAFFCCNYYEAKYSKNPFLIKGSNGVFEITCNENFNFSESSENFQRPLSVDLDNATVKLKNYLAGNPHMLIINGYYTGDEKNNTPFSNLGLARANKVKDYLVSKGIPVKLISTYGELKNDLVPDRDGVFHGPLNFNLVVIKKVDTLQTKCDKLKKTPLLFYFDFAVDTPTLSNEEKAKLIDISHCSSVNGKRQITIVGHTDNIGSHRYNDLLSRRRAENVKEMLIKAGGLEQNIVTKYKGKREPMSDNRSDEGRAKNRRVVIKIN